MNMDQMFQQQEQQHINNNFQDQQFRNQKVVVKHDTDIVTYYKGVAITRATYNLINEVHNLIM